MRYWEILVFCLGISLDVFGAAVCQGAVLGELRRRRIAAYCLIFCAAQVAAMEIGRLLGMLPRFASYYTVAQGLWHILGALIGSGVCASHGMERTHIKGLEATLKLMYLYLCGEE